MEDKLHVELSQQQQNELKRIEEILKLEALKNTCEKFQSDLEHLKNEKKQHLQTREQLKERLDNVKKELHKVSEDKVAAQEKLDASKKQTAAA